MFLVFFSSLITFSIPAHSNRFFILFTILFCIFQFFFKKTTKRGERTIKRKKIREIFLFFIFYEKVKRFCFVVGFFYFNSNKK
jgi:uncharacterized membrane protein YfcA